MNSNPLISVIIPVYNTSKYLMDCLDSVINQTYDNLEIITINDGSIDNSLEILNKYKQIDKRIKVINKKNEGGGPARNAGLDLASGDYIAFVDSDDKIERNMYKTMLEAIDANNVDMCICGYKTSEGEVFSGSLKDSIILNNHDLMEELFKDESITSHLWRKLYPRKCFINNRFTNQKVVHDMEADTYFIKNIDSAIVIHDPLYIYTTNNASNLSNSNASNINSSFNRARTLINRLEFADKYYPDLSCILIPKVVMFMLSSYAKITKGKPLDTDKLDYVKKYLIENEKRIMDSTNVPLSYKVVVYSINHNLKLISSLASSYYMANMEKISKK